MAELYNLFIDAGVAATPASWGTVIVTIIVLSTVIWCFKELIFPRRK